MSTLYIIRGISGSGKSTYASKLGVLTFEADQFFMVDGRYEWSGDRLSHAHSWCKGMVEHIMSKGGMDVCVSNTNTRIKEFMPYIEMANNHGYDVKVIRCIGEFHNTHNVPEAILKNMKDRFENFDGEQIYDPRY